MTLSQPEALALAWRASHAGLAVGAGDKDEPLPHMLVREGIDRVVAIDACQSLPRPAIAVCRLAEALLVQHGGQFYARAHPAWHKVAQVVDGDMLVAWSRRNHSFGRFVREDVAALDWPAVLRIEPDVLDRLQRRPMAETHLHLGGALPTSVLWDLALREDSLPFEGLGTGWPAALGEARRLRDTLVTAIELGSVNPSSEAHVTFHDWATRALPIRTARGQDTHDHPWRIEGSWLLGALAPERLLLASAFRLAREPWPALERYLQLRNAFHHALLQHRDERGLHHFRSVNGRRNFQFLGADRLRTRAAKHRALLQERVRCAQVVEAILHDAADHVPREQAGAIPPLDLELRASIGAPNALREALEARLAGVADALRSWSRPVPGADGPPRRRVPPLRVGFVLHFSKSQPVDESTLNALRQILEPASPLRSFLVGFDAAGDELASPPRQWISAFCSLRRLHDEQPPAPTPIRLGFSFHVGEDIRDLLTSLRHVEEAATFLCPGPRDRLGHATALFWEPARYFQRHRYTWPTLGDHLLDLVWAWDRLRAAEGPERALAAVAEDLLRRRIPGLELGRIDRAAARLRDPGRRHEPDADGSELRALQELLECVDASVRAPIEIDNVSARWQAMVTALRNLLRASLVTRGMVVEVNPTSNLFVGGLSGYADLPYLRAEAEDPEGWPRRVRWSINTDDPGIFQTTLRNEHAWAARGLHDLGLEPQAIHGVLDRARRAGRESSLLPPWSPRGSALLKLGRAFGRAD